MTSVLRTRARVRRGLFLLGLICAFAAWWRSPANAAEPATGAPGADIVLALDVSRSMWATDRAPDRLTLAKRCIRTLAAKAHDHRVALVAFAGASVLVSPLTRDASSVAALADEADPSMVPRGGTDLSAALAMALDLLPGATSRGAHVVLLTDGEDHDGQGLREARRANVRGVRVHAIGLGTALGSKIPLALHGGTGFVKDRTGSDVISRLVPASLQAMADVSGGRFTEASGPDALAALVDDVVARAAASASASAVGRMRWLVWLAVACWLLTLALTEARRGGVAVLGCVLLTACGVDPGHASFQDACARLRARDWAGVQAAAQQAVDRGGARYRPLQSFLRGNVAFGQSLATNDAPKAFALAEDALAHWRVAATSRADWPAARRNVERALLRLHQLRVRAKPKRKPPPPPPDNKPKAAKAKVETQDLAPGAVLQLLKVLARKDQERLRARRDARARSSADVERDW